MLVSIVKHIVGLCSRHAWVIVAAALFWMAILFAFTLADFYTRGWLSTQTG